jgi:hypothetical protein
VAGWVKQQTAAYRTKRTAYRTKNTVNRSKPYLRVCIFVYQNLSLLMRKAFLLFWSKADIAAAIDVNPRYLDCYLSEEIKTAVNWQKGRQQFNQSQVFTIIKSLNSRWSDDFIGELIDPFSKKQMKKQA